MLKWFRRSPAPVEAVRDFVDTIEFINVLLAREAAHREAVTGTKTGAGAHTSRQADKSR